MLSPKPWKLEAVLRLFMRLFICMCLGWVVLALSDSKAHSGHEHGRLIVLAAAAAIFLGVALVLLGKPWTAQNFLSTGLAVLIVFYVGLVLAMWTQHLAGAPAEKTSARQMIVSMLSLQGATLVLGAFFLREQSLTWREAFGFSNNAKKAILIGLVAAALFLPVASFLKLISERGIELFTHEQPAQQEAVQAIQATPGVAYRILLGVFTLVLAPWGEEVLFRGILYSTIKQAGFPRLAFALSSILFATIHMNAGIFLPLLLLAMLLAWLYNKTDNLLAPIITHTVFNAVGFIYIIAKDLS